MRTLPSPRLQPSPLTVAILVALSVHRPPRHFALAEGDDQEGVRRVITNSIELAEGVQRSWVTLTRAGKFYDPRYGEFEITTTMLAEMVRNFDARVVGDDIFLDVHHKPENGAAARVLALRVDGGRLRAQVEWTPYGIEAVRNKGYRYLSAEFNENWQDNEARKQHGCVLLGAGLTIRPVIKRLDPVLLAVADDPDFSGPVFVHPGIVQTLTESLEKTVMKRWEKFLARLAAKNIKLSEQALASLKAAFEAATKTLAESDDDIGIADQFEAVAKSLAEQPGATINLSVTAPAGGGEEEIAKAVEKALAEKATAEKKLADDLAGAQKAFDDTLAATKDLGDDTRKQLADARSLIAASWTADQAKALAEQQIKVGEQIEASRKLAAMGFAGGAGSVRIATGGGNHNEVKALAEETRKQLASTGFAGAGGLKVVEEDKLPPFVQKVLAQFDAENGYALQRELEAKKLAGGPVVISDMALPASVQREVIREALSDLNILPLIDAAVEPTSAPTHTIPYETRDLTGVSNDGTAYEGQPISYAGVKQANDFAYIEPLKLAINVSNEAAHFSANNPHINWDAYARTVSSASRAVREIIQRRLANRWLRSSDSFGAVQITGAAAAAGTVTGNYKLASPNYPLVRPRTIRDLQGNVIGAVQHPLVVNVAGSPIAAYNGTGTQPAGNYYLDNRNLYELGVVTVVNQAGVPQGALTVTVTGWRVTNVALFDTDLPANTKLEDHLNGLLRTFGARKALLADDRFVSPNMALMSPTLADTISNASNFEEARGRADVSINAMGDLGPVKGVPTWSSNAPNLDLGDSRILLSQRGLLRYRISKAFALGAPFEMIDPASGKPIGKKQAYGEEFSSAHIPAPLDGYSTSVLVWSTAARAAL